jgi:enoyl-CoA hydratase/carnithine racemase
MTDKIQTRIDGAVQWLIFNQPEKHNALSLDMTIRALEVIEAFDQDDSLRVLVLAGAGGKAFVSGADISEFDKRRNNAETAAEYANISNRMFDAVYETGKPTIAMINGYCFGGGVALAASCDMRYSADDGLFAIPAARLGIAYRVSFTRRVVDLVGPARAKEILYTARRYGAEEAAAMGLVNRVYPRASLQEEVDGLAAKIAENAPLSIRASKATVSELISGDPDIARCEEMIRTCSDSSDFAEGRKAFAEKRPPVFTGS